MWLKSKADGKCFGVISKNIDDTTDIFQRAKHMRAFHLPAKERKEIEAAGKVFKAENQSTVCRQPKPVSKKGSFSLERWNKVMLGKKSKQRGYILKVFSYIRKRKNTP